MNETPTTPSDSPMGLPVPAGKALPSKDLRFYACAALIVILAAALRFLFITRFQVWLDEAYCFMVARKPIPLVLSYLASDNGPPLYYVMLHYWMLVFGDSAAALRSLSAVFSVATVAALFFWDAPWFSRTARLAAAFLLAIMPLSIHYAQEARMYSPVVFFVFVSMVFLERGLRVGGIANWALFTVFTALGLYTSYVAVYLVPVGYAAIAGRLFFRHTRANAGRSLISLLLAHALAAALFLPWLPTYFRQPSDKAVQWMGPIWDDSTKVMLPVRSVLLMTTGGAYYPRYLINLFQDPDRTKMVRKMIKEGTETRALPKFLSRIPAQFPFDILILLTAAVLFMALRRSGGPPFRVLLLSWVLLSSLVPIALSFIRPMFVVGRHDLVGIGGFAALSGVGFARMSGRVRAAALSLASLLFLYAWSYAEIWPVNGANRIDGAAIAAVASSGDVILCETFEYAQVYYHIGPKRDSVTFLTVPRDTIEHAAWIDYDRWLLSDGKTPRSAMWEEAATALSAAIEKTPPGHKLVILRPVNPPDWADGMDQTLEPAVMKAIDSGLVTADMHNSVPEKGIVVLLKGGGGSAQPGTSESGQSSTLRDQGTAIQ